MIRVEAEVGHPRHVARAEEHVLRLEVEVDQLLHVHGAHAARDAREHLGCLEERAEAPLGDG